eukprot:1006889-Pelagomonas_calceolata.AAC.1
MKIWRFVSCAPTGRDGRRRVRASRSMANNPPDPHKICFWLSPGLTVSRVGLEGLLMKGLKRPYLPVPFGLINF